MHLVVPSGTVPTDPVRLVPSPKPGGIRWLVELGPAVADEYARLVAPAVPAVEPRLSAAVLANRVVLASRVPPRIELEPWGPARARFETAVGALARDARAVLLTDVRDCYGSISPTVAARSLRWMGLGRGVASAVEGFLRHVASSGVRGLPIGPSPSAVLANAVLAEVDRALAGAGFRHLRWVDDVLVFLPGRTEADRALRLVEGALRTLGLRTAAEKTRVVIDPASLSVTARASGPPARHAVG